MRIAIIGGGPVGVEAALYGAALGLDVQLFERGRLGENARAWGHVAMFTEWARNRSPLAEKLLRERGDTLPDAQARPTGDDLADYLLRLASLPLLRGHLAPQTEVVSIAREGLLKSDLWRDPRRQKVAFRLLTRGVAGEKTRLFDAVLDCTGLYASPNFAGSGGAPCAGEIALERVIDYAIPDIAGRDRNRFLNAHTLVVGAGHSAATTALTVADLFERGSKTRLTWIIRRPPASDGSIYILDPNDVASGRRQLGERANALLNHPRVDVRFGTVVEALTRRAGVFAVALSDGTSVECQNVCAHTGFRPDENLWRELQIAPHPATGAPSLALGESLHGANLRAGVGLSTGYGEKTSEFTRPENDENQSARDLLRLDEPNFYVLGIKSYGRDAGFLLQNGFRQVRDVYRLLCNDPNRDLYGEF